MALTGVAMYTYIVERTQTYLSAKQTEEVDKRARDQGTTRSHLIREAVEKYLAPDWDAEAFKAALMHCWHVGGLATTWTTFAN